MSGYAKLRKTQGDQRKKIAAGDVPQKLLGIGFIVVGVFLVARS